MPHQIGFVNPKFALNRETSQFRCLRISHGTRYSEDFEPEKSFVADPKDFPSRAVLIYDGSKIEGNRVIDLSGGGNDGHFEFR